MTDEQSFVAWAFITTSLSFVLNIIAVLTNITKD